MADILIGKWLNGFHFSEFFHTGNPA